MAFLGLLVSDEGVLRAHLKKLEDWYMIWCRAEEASHDNALIRGLLQDMIWPSMQWPRMVMISLHEAGWQSVPESVHSELTEWSHGFVSTKVTEDVIAELRRAESHSQSGELKNTARWLVMSEGKSIMDHGRKHLIASPHSSELAGATLPAQLYNPEHLKQPTDLPPSFLADLHSSSPSFRVPDAKNFDSIPLQWSALLRLRDQWDKLAEVWHSALA
eukprot:6490362-Amphidinium_carterae.4